MDLLEISIIKLIISSGLENPYYIKNSYYIKKYLIKSNNQNVVDNVVENVAETNEDKIINLLKQSPSLSAAKLGKLIGLGDRQIQRITQNFKKKVFLLELDQIGKDIE